MRKLPSQRRRLLSRPSLRPLRQIDGQITKILVAAGDRVRQGAPLMQIDARLQQAAVSSQQAELAADIKELQELKAQNNEILKDQQAALDVLEQLEKDADQLRIYSKRG